MLKLVIALDVSSSSKNLDERHQITKKEQTFRTFHGLQYLGAWAKIMSFCLAHRKKSQFESTSTAMSTANPTVEAGALGMAPAKTASLPAPTGDSVRTQS